MDRRVSKLAALAILMAALYAAWALAISPAISLFEGYNDAIDAAENAILRHRRILQMRHTFEKQVAESSRQRVLNEGFLAGPSPELGIAALQGRVKSIVESSGGRLTSLRALSPEDDGGFIKVGVRAVASGSITSLAEMFYSIETDWPALFIDNVNVRARVNRARTKIGGQEGTRNFVVDRELGIEFSVYGLVLASAEAVQRRSAQKVR